MERETLQSPDKKGKIEASREVERGRRERETEIERGSEPRHWRDQSLTLSFYIFVSCLYDLVWICFKLILHWSEQDQQEWMLHLITSHWQNDSLSLSVPLSPFFSLRIIQMQRKSDYVSIILGSTIYNQFTYKLYSPTNDVSSYAFQTVANKDERQMPSASTRELLKSSISFKNNLLNWVATKNERRRASKDSQNKKKLRQRGESPKW